MKKSEELKELRNARNERVNKQINKMNNKDDNSFFNDFFESVKEKSKLIGVTGSIGLASFLMFGQNAQEVKTIQITPEMNDCIQEIVSNPAYAQKVALDESGISFLQGKISVKEQATEQCRTKLKQ